MNISMNDVVVAPKFRTTFESPIGTLLALASDDALCVLHMLGAKHAPRETLLALEARPSHRVFTQLRRELDEYFSGMRQQFEVTLAPAGTAFQRSAWQALTKIPYGSTCTYGDQAKHMKNPGAVRAVGSANGRNPVGIIIPCHRVIGRDGSLTGYAGGVEKKALLLGLESQSKMIREPRMTEVVASE
jgi:methylated-DNA-[protein]-cysteine S-methyltransferase